MSCRSKKQLTKTETRTEARRELSLASDSRTQEHSMLGVQIQSLTADTMMCTWIDFDTSLPCDTATGLPPVKRMGRAQLGRTSQTTASETAASNKSSTANTAARQTSQEYTRERQTERKKSKLVFAEIAGIAVGIALMVLMILFFRKWYIPPQKN